MPPQCTSRRAPILPALTASLLAQFGISAGLPAAAAKPQICIFLPLLAESKGAGWKAVQLVQFVVHNISARVSNYPSVTIAHMSWCVLMLATSVRRRGSHPCKIDAFLARMRAGIWYCFQPPSVGLAPALHPVPAPYCTSISFACTLVPLLGPPALHDTSGHAGAHRVPGHDLCLDFSS